MTKRIIVEIVIIVLALTLLWGISWEYGQHKYLWNSGWKAQVGAVSTGWLTEVIATTDKGQPITRAMMLDALCAQALKSNQPAPTAKKK